MTLSVKFRWGVRPVAIAFNPVNQQLYVANLVSHTVTVIDTLSESVITTLAVGQHPTGIGVHPESGAIYVANSADDTLSVFDADDTLITTIAGAGNHPVSLTYHPLHEQMYVVAAASNAVIPIDENYNLQAPIAVGGNPFQAVFNTNNNYLYVGNRADQTFTVLGQDNSIRATLALGHAEHSFAINQATNTLFSAATSANAVNRIGYLEQSSQITINEDYSAKKADFQHHPAIIQHLKVILSGEQRLHTVLKLQQKTMTGTIKTTPLSLSQYNSPQHFLNVYEVSAIKGVMLDGINRWNVKIPAGQTLTFMVSYQQSNDV